MRLAPLMVICDPSGALEGEIELMVGDAVESTSKKLGVPIEFCLMTFAVPPEVVMTIKQLMGVLV